jgi:hypothetical protein
MDRITRNQSFGIFVAAARILLLLAALGRLAEARQPPNASLLLGTWVNVKNTDFFSVARIVITDVSGDFEVHPYGFCSPTLCDWGMHPAFRFSSSVVSSTAFGFNVVFGLGLKSVYMQGHLIKTPTGETLLEVTTQRRFLRLSNELDYERTERFRLK